MEADFIEADKKQLSLEDGSIYFYSVRPVEITNVLGITVAVLDEYFISNSSGEVYKLYKSKEGNWYDGLKENYELKNKVLMTLKFAIEKKQIA